MNNLGFNIKGLEEIQKAIVEKYSGTKSRAVIKEAVSRGGDLVVDALKDNFSSFKDKGYSQEEIVKSNVSFRDGEAKIKIGWNGPHGRWRIVHLNEFGYTKMGKQYTPGGFGAIEKTLKETEAKYLNEVARELKNKL